MDEGRQAAFQKLRPPCVDLSAVALKFRTQQAPIKDVLSALERVHGVLSELGNNDLLDTKLADYAFFPLAQQIFNETKRLSPRCIEIAVKCVTILVSKGFQQSLNPELGKQLLILMTTIAGASPDKAAQQPTDEVQSATFRCISSIVHELAATSDGAAVLDNQGTKNVVDQLVYLLLERIEVSVSDVVQISASQALESLMQTIKNRVFLASLLPRTVSALTKALRPSTKSRRTQQVLSTNLRVLQTALIAVLADDVSLEPNDEAEKVALDKSWIIATAAQVKNAIAQVTKMRISDSVKVCQALQSFCVGIVDRCSQSLADSIPILVETLIVLSTSPVRESALQSLQHLMITLPDIGDFLRQSLMEWSQSIPRLMNGVDEKPKDMMLRRLTATVDLFTNTHASLDDLDEPIASNLMNGVASAISAHLNTATEMSSSGPNSMDALIRTNFVHEEHFDPVILNQSGQKQTLTSLEDLVGAIRKHPAHDQITRRIIDSVADSTGNEQLSALWLATNLLKDDPKGQNVDEFLNIDAISDSTENRDSLLNDLAELTLPLITGADDTNVSKRDWRVIALAVEALVLNAERYPADIYRPELVDTLYPVLALLGSPNSLLRSHAITALNRLAATCQYSSAADMLTENADYLVNSIAWNLNTYNLSPEAPQILRMMIKLCGPRLIPYLDDLIQSIFAALDNYHAYPNLVELLFSALKTMVDESVRNPDLAITEGRTSRVHNRTGTYVSTVDDILDDLQARKRRKLDFSRDASQPPTAAPKRPWTSQLDGPSFPRVATDEDNDGLTEKAENTLQNGATDEAELKLTRSHQMLLSIANATAPHFASPSPRVRKLLLDLLYEITPLLSRDENTFLPLINSIWPVIVPRLFADSGSEEDPAELAYNICAATDTITILCQNAGNFMSSRIESVFQQLVKLFRQTFEEVKSQRKPATTGPESRIDNQGNELHGTVGLQIIKPPLGSETNDLAESRNLQTTFTPQHTRTSKGQVLNALIRLLSAILGHVRMSADKGDEMFQLLAPLMNQPGREDIRSALESYHADLVWLSDLKRAVKEDGTTQPVVGSHSHCQALIGKKPALRPILQDRGIHLSSVVI